MRFRSILSIAFLITACALVGCASTTPMFGEMPNRAAGAKGGDADGKTGALDVKGFVVQPGGELRASEVKNEDQVQSSQAAPALTLNLVSDFSAAVKGDAVVQSYAAVINMALAEYQAAETPEAKAAAKAVLNAERVAMAKRLKTLRAEMSETAAASVTHLIYNPVIIMSIGQTEQKFDAQTGKLVAAEFARAVPAPKE